jgi:hypothetical protein
MASRLLGFLVRCVSMRNGETNGCGEHCVGIHEAYTITAGRVGSGLGRIQLGCVEMRGGFVCCGIWCLGFCGSVWMSENKYRGWVLRFWLNEDQVIN